MTTKHENPFKPKTQNHRLWAYLNKGHAITSANAVMVLGILQLQSRFCEFQGWSIRKRWVKVRTKFGPEVRVMEYRAGWL